MSSYNDQMQSLASDFMAATGTVQFSLKEMGLWAIQNGLWQPEKDAVLRQFCGDMARALREDYILDPQGRRIRAKHAIKTEGEQGVLWADINTAPHEHMVVAFSQRRDQVIADCAQLKADVDSYNENQNKGRPVQMSLDFTKDVNEFELARERDKKR